MFLNCPLERVRIAFADVTVHAIATLAPYERDLYVEILRTIPKESEDYIPTSSSVINIVEYFLSVSMVISFSILTEMSLSSRTFVETLGLLPTISKY